MKSKIRWIVRQDDVFAVAHGEAFAPMVVETTALPIAMASKILIRVPLPLRKGTTQTTALAR